MRPVPSPVCSLFTLCDGDFGSEYKKKKKKKKKKQLIRSVGGHVHNLTTSYFERKETKFVFNKTAIYGRNRSSLGLLFVKLARVSVFSSLSDQSHTQVQAGSMPSTQAVAPSPNHNRDGSEKVRTFDNGTHRHKRFDRQIFVSIFWLRHA